MKTIQEKDLLMERITALEIKQVYELQLLKEQFRETLEQLNPLYTFKRKFQDLIATPDIKSKLLHNAVEVSSQLLFKNTLLGTFQKPIKNIVGNLILKVLNKLSPSKHKLL